MRTYIQSEAGYRALLVSVDLPVLGNRLNEARNNFAWPKDCKFPNLEVVETGEGGSAGLVSTDALDYGKSKNRCYYMTYQLTGVDASISWEEHIPWLQKHTNMQVWLKGGMKISPILFDLD